MDQQEQHLITVATPIAMIPAKYREAVQALEQCTTINEARYWNNLSDALKAYSKMYTTDDDAMKAARRLKLHAYRRMSAIAKQLADEEEKTVAQVMKAAKAKTMTIVSAFPIHNLHPKKKKPDRRVRASAARVLAAQGLKVNQVNEITRIGRIPESRFQEMVDLTKKPPAIHKAAYEGHRRQYGRPWSEESYMPLMGRGNTAGANLAGFVVFTQRYKPELVRALPLDEAQKVREHIVAVQEWCDAIERFLPKSKPAATPTAKKHK